MKKAIWIVVGILLLSSASWAHGNLEHVLGTVTAVTDHSLTVKTLDGSVKVVEFDAQTHFLRGEAAATAKDVRVGDRVVIHAHKHGEEFQAAEVKIGTNATTATK